MCISGFNPACFFFHSSNDNVFVLKIHLNNKHCLCVLSVQVLELFIVHFCGDAVLEFFVSALN